MLVQHAVHVVIQTAVKRHTQRFNFVCSSNIGTSYLNALWGCSPSMALSSAVDDRVRLIIIQQQLVGEKPVLHVIYAFGQTSNRTVVLQFNIYLRVVGVFVVSHISIAVDDTTDRRNVNREQQSLSTLHWATPELHRLRAEIT